MNNLGIHAPAASMIVMVIDVHLLPLDDDVSLFSSLKSADISFTIGLGLGGPRGPNRSRNSSKVAGSLWVPIGNLEKTSHVPMNTLVNLTSERCLDDILVTLNIPLSGKIPGRLRWRQLWCWWRWNWSPGGFKHHLQGFV